MRTVAAIAIVAFGVCTTVQVNAAGAGVAASSDDKPPSRIERVERGLEPLPAALSGQSPLPLDLQQAMKLNAVPGLSVAVIDNFKVVWTKAYGTTSAEHGAPVTTHTLFQAGSISKPVTAAGMLSLVEHGKLVLDEDVNKRLTSWKVPENEFTRAEKVTLRRLASHTAGVTVSGFPGYDIGDPQPTLQQIFDGAPPANSPAIRVDFVPGSQTRYSGGGITIEQQLMMDATKRDFPGLMHELVLSRLGMNDSSFAQPLSAESAAHAASGTLADGSVVHGKWHVYPEMAAAGLWTTPSDLARFAIETALASQGRSNKLMSKKLAHEMIAAQPGIEGSGGLGFFPGHAQGEFEHLGVDWGFQALLRMNADTGQGVVVMANSDNGLLVGFEFVDSVAREYHWKNAPEPRFIDRQLILVAKARGVESALSVYEMWKKANGPSPLAEQVLPDLGSHLMRAGKVVDGIVVLRRNALEYPQSAQAHAMLGRALVVAGKFDEADRSIKEALRIEPDNEDARESLSKLAAKISK